MVEFRRTTVATALAVESLLVYLVRYKSTVFRVLDRPIVVYHHRGEVTRVGQGGVTFGTFCGDTTGKAVCGVGSSKASERQRPRGLRTGAYTEEFGNTGISDVSGSPAMASGLDSSATGVGVTGASLDVDGPSC